MFKEFLAIACLAAGAFALGGADAASNVVQYVYDAAGNIVAIQRINPAPVTVAGFAPTAGPVGTSVAISGTGFAATAAQNVVSFNGMAATVNAASPTTLTAVVPAGATTGRITVTVAGNTVVSAQDFIVTARRRLFRRVGLLRATSSPRRDFPPTARRNASTSSRPASTDGCCSTAPRARG